MRALGILGCLMILISSPSSATGDDGFRQLFDGATLEGWRGDIDYWSVVDGAIVGNTKPNGIRANTFLIAEGEYADFVLRAKFKLTNHASGIQFRSRVLGKPSDYRVTGYQADIGGGGTGEFYEEKGRSTLVRPNRQVIERYLKKGEWNQYEIKMIGNEGEIRVNGQVTARYVEKDPAIPRSGLIALQLQAGSGMEIAFKDIEIREITPDAWKTQTMLVSRQRNQTRVRTAVSDETVFQCEEPQRAIEWALAHARSTIVREGEYLIADRIDIPRGGVTLVIDQGAKIELRENTNHASIGFGSNRNPGYWQIVPLIYNKGHDDVRVLVLGTLVHSLWDKKTSGKQTFPIIFDGRNEQKTCGIHGGTMLVTGKSTQSFWLVDAKGIDVPLLTLNTGLDAAIVLEGCEDCSLGMIANLASTSGGNSGETVDLNSRSTGIILEQLVGERAHEIIDCNESHAVVHEAVSIGQPRKLFGGDVGSGPRFTSRPKLRTRSLDVKKTTILADATGAQLNIDVPDIAASLPRFNIGASVVVTLKDGSSKTYRKAVEIDLR